MKNTALTLSLIFLASLALRASYIIFYDNGKMLDNKYYSADEYSYGQIAKNFLAGKGFVTDDGLYARRGPVYPFVLAVIYYLFGYYLVVARFIQAIIGAVTCIIIYLLGKELFDSKIGLISLFISAIYYPFIQYPAYLLNEVVFTFILVVCLFFFTRYHKNKQGVILFTASVFLGIASLCRSSSLPLAIFIVLWLGLLFSFDIKKIIKPILILIAGLSIIVIPWIIRNYKIYKVFVPITIESGRILYYGNNPQATGGTGGWTINEQDQFIPDNINNPTSLEADNIMFRAALKYMISHPKRTITLGFKKLINMWRPFYSNARTINKIIMSVFQIPIMILALVGIIKTFSERSDKYVLCYMITIYFVILHIITISNIRYRYPIMPFLIIFCAYGAVYLFNKLSKLIHKNL